MLTPDQEKLKEAAQFASPGPWKGDRHDGTVKYELLDANDNTVIMGDNNNNPDGPFGINRYEDEVYLKLAHPAAVSDILAQLDNAQTDAERYRWLMRNYSRIIDEAAIDAAMAAESLPPPEAA